MPNLNVYGRKKFRPIFLRLSPVQEQILRNNLDIFLKNGFDFTFNDLDDRNRVQMTSVPNFIGIQCGINEVEEILSYLSESDNITDTNYRPEKVLKGFASKACRKSVMVGDQLEIKQMQTLVNRLAFLDKPWY
uniref:MutL C-terminal dimerisation domain-containing protein n=1 Tax=Panagrolaimus superbus TaxID=310955 RepID=A0A914Y4K1_9BILA